MSSFDHFTISWTGSTDNVGVAGYRIMRNGALLGTTTATTYLDGGLAAATTYTYTIVAFDAAGNASAASAPVSISTQGTQSQPSISSFGASPTTIGAGQSTSLSWLTGGATTLTITPAPGTVIPSNGSVSVSPAATTTYTLTASNTAGSVSASVTVTVGSTTPDTTPPSPPSNTTAVATSGSQVIVSWVASPEADVAGYKVTRNGAPLSSTASTSYLDSGLAGSTVYTYTVTAFDTAGNTSAASVPASVTTPAGTPSGPPPSAPGNGIVITDLSGAGQANRPFTISRVFVQGEFPAGSYPQARIGGSGGTRVLTLADVKNTWPDGSLRHVMISFAASIPASGNLIVDFVSQFTPNNTGYLDKSGMVNHNSGSWGADFEVTNGSS